jgi:N-acetylneuraminic acid mutarotase
VRKEAQRRRARRPSLIAAVATLAVIASAATASGADTLGTWTPASRMADARMGGAVGKLPDGRVLVAGGTSQPNQPAISTTEIYDPTADVWAAAEDLGTPRQQSGFATLPNGDLLVAGGYDGAWAALDTAEIFRAATGHWEPVTNTMSAAHGAPVAVALGAGKVLVVGGNTSGGQPSSAAEIYDAAANDFTPASAMGTPRTNLAAAPLPDGRVLVVGGADNSGSVASAEVYDPATDTWTPTANDTTVPRMGAAVAPISGGRVLVVGGVRAATPAPQINATADVYDPATNRFTPTATMSVARYGASATALGDGRVLVAGGGDRVEGAGLHVTNSAELYDPASGSWLPAPAMIGPRALPGAALLNDGSVLLAGGASRSAFDGSVPADATAERYVPARVPTAPTAVSAAAGDASAFVSWVPTASSGSALRSYTVTSSPGGVTATVTDGRTGVVVAGLNNGTTYTFTVTATNGMGTSPASAPSNPVTPKAAAAVTGPPEVKISGLRSRYTAAAFRRGVRATIRVTPASALDVSLVGSAATAKIARAYNLTLARKHLGRMTRRTVTLRPNRKLVGRAQRFRVRLVVVATDAQGNRRTVTKTLRIAPASSRH